MIFWFIGISGAGKTTLGSHLCDYLDTKGIPNYRLDGDEVRAVFDGDLGYSSADRETNIKRIILAAYVLDRCGIVGIICNIAPFERLRTLAREKITGYHEIFLRKDLHASKENDVKGVYADNLGRSDLVGVEIGFDEPQNPDLIIEVDRESVEESFHKVVEYVERVIRNESGL